MGDSKVNMDFTKERLLATTLMAGLAIGGLAQTAQAQGGEEAGAIVVTGSRIPQPNLTSVSPVTAVSSEEIKLQGVTKVENLINNLPQAFADQGGTISNGAVGTATVNLRNLGPSRTLVLIDGRRVVPGDPSYPYADLNFIPSSLIDRVEVDTGGASAVYGSDAVAGVVNFIMNRNFEGVRIDGNYNFYSHNNDNGIVQDALTRKGFSKPPSDVNDGETSDITLTMGVNTGDGKGNVTAYIGYRNTQPILQGARDYSACTTALNAAKNGYNCSGSATTPHGTFFVFNTAFATTASVTLDEAAPNNFRPWNSAADVYNFAPLNYYQRPDERYVAGAFAHYEVNPNLDIYSEFMFMDDHSVSQIAESGVFGQTIAVSCTNPFLSANEVATICAPGNVDPATIDAQAPLGRANVAVLRRNVEGGPRQDDLRHTDYRLVAGIRGNLTTNWRYDLYGQYGTAIYAERYLNDVSLSHVAQALDVIAGPGGPVCASGALGCVPYNIWQIGAVTPDQTTYFGLPGFKEGSTSEQVVSGVLTGDFGDAFKSPWAQDPVGAAVGAEYRRESLNLDVDNEFFTGDLAGQGGPTQPVAGAFDVFELFGEARVPIVQDAPLAKELSLELGYRYSKYSSSADQTDTYKVGGNWAPSDDLRFRASYQRAVRAPNVVELFSPQVIGLDFNKDNCAGATPTFTAAQCANTGVSAAQYGHVAGNPAAQYNGFIGGNPNLKPEVSDTYSVGFVARPEFIPGFNLSVDYYQIKVEDVIQGYGSQNIIDTCARTGDPVLCALVHRAPGTGSLWLGTNGFVVNTTQNSGFVETAGVDVEANYHFDLDNVGVKNGGALSFQFQGSWTDYYKVQALPVFAEIDCVGLYGVTCQGTGTPMTAPTPEWRHKLRTTWDTPMKGLQVSLDWRYLGEVTNDTGNTALFDYKLKAQNYFDVSGSWTFKDNYTFRAGVNNVLDKDPPVIGSTELPSVVGSGNTYPQFYDALGRYVYAGVTLDF
jgi:outer membrane receptor protein involved in Fe transport